MKIYRLLPMLILVASCSSGNYKTDSNRHPAQTGLADIEGTDPPLQGPPAPVEQIVEEVDTADELSGTTDSSEVNRRRFDETISWIENQELEEDHKKFLKDELFKYNPSEEVRSEAFDLPENNQRLFKFFAQYGNILKENESINVLPMLKAFNDPDLGRERQNMILSYLEDPNLPKNSIENESELKKVLTLSFEDFKSIPIDDELFLREFDENLKIMKESSSKWVELFNNYFVEVKVASTMKKSGDTHAELYAKASQVIRASETIEPEARVYLINYLYEYTQLETNEDSIGKVMDKLDPLTLNGLFQDLKTIDITNGEDPSEKYTAVLHKHFDPSKLEEVEAVESKVVAEVASEGAAEVVLENIESKAVTEVTSEGAAEIALERIQKVEILRKDCNELIASVVAGGIIGGAGGYYFNKNYTFDITKKKKDVE